jgi:quercetin dioxygenase-like cupin family protein
MNKAYTLLSDITRAVEPPADGTLSRTVYQDDRLKAVLFGFSAGQELPEHTASTPAVMHFLSGEADVTLGRDHVTAAAGTWIHMPPQLRHSIRARTPVTMLLLLLKQPPEKGNATELEASASGIEA